MLKVYVKRGGKIVEGSISSLSSKGVVWIDSLSPTPEELEQIKKRTKISLKVLKKYTDRTERPHLIQYEKFTKIVYGVPYENNGFKINPLFVFIFGNNKVLTLRNRDVGAIKKFKKRIIEAKTSSFDSPHLLLSGMFDEVATEYFRIFDEIEDKIEGVEHLILRKPTKTSIERIFRVKKSLIFLHKALSANREVITSIEKGYISKLTKDEARHFRDLYQDLVQLIDMGETFRDILTGMIDIYLSSLSNNINEVMRKLTVYGSFILVPTLITGVYGMNFKFMPEIVWKYGYIFALFLMVFSVTWLYIFFKRKEWI